MLSRVGHRTVSHSVELGTSTSPYLLQYAATVASSRSTIDSILRIFYSEDDRIRIPSILDHCTLIYQPGAPIGRFSCQDANYFHIVAVIWHMAKTRKYSAKLLQIAHITYKVCRATSRHPRASSLILILFHMYMVSLAVECSRLTPRDFLLFSCSL